MLDFSQTPGYPGYKMVTYYVTCPRCGRVLQQVHPTPHIAVITCICGHRFPAYGHFEEEAE